MIVVIFWLPSADMWMSVLISFTVNTFAWKFPSSFPEEKKNQKTLSPEKVFFSLLENVFSWY